MPREGIPWDGTPRWARSVGGLGVGDLSRAVSVAQGQLVALELVGGHLGQGGGVLVLGVLHVLPHATRVEPNGPMVRPSGGVVVQVAV